MSKNIKTYFHENAGILAALVALCILLAILPVVVVYILLSKSIIKGVTAGSVKG